MKKFSQSGFAAIEAILILVIVAMVGGTGYYVWHAKQNTDKSLDSANKTTTVSKTSVAKDTVDPKTHLATFTSASGVFSVQYPSNWVKPSRPDLCGDYLKNNLEVGPDAQSVIACGSDGSVSQVSVSYTTGEKAGNPGDTLKLTGYRDYQTSTVIADGVQGIMYSAVASGQSQGIGALPDGTIVAVDVFTKGDVVIVANYHQYPGTSKEGPTSDQRATFDQIVHSIKFLK